MAMIICGFPGVGKSCVATNRTNILDAESSAFSWIIDPVHLENGRKRNPEFPGNYIRYIRDNMDKYEVILVSSHQSVRDALKAESIPYIIVAPYVELRNEYMKRYLQRGSTMEFIDILYNAWLDFLGGIERDGAPTIWLDSGEYMSDALGHIAR